MIYIIIFIKIFYNLNQLFIKTVEKTMRHYTYEYYGQKLYRNKTWVDDKSIH